MCHAIEFIETSLFTRQIKQLASDEDLRALQRQLIGNPDFGDLIQDTGGLRKSKNGDRLTGKKRRRAGDLFSGNPRDHLSRLRLPQAHQREPGRSGKKRTQETDPAIKK